MSLLLENLKSSYMASRLHPCWIFKDEDFTRAADVALELAQFILSQNSQNPTGMSSSIVAHQMKVGSYPNFYHLEPGKNEDGEPLQEIGVGQVRDLIGYVQKTPPIPGWRVVYIPAAHKLNTAASNALLKALEEPSPQILYILITPSLGMVLPTIRSRSQKLDFGPSETRLNFEQELNIPLGEIKKIIQLSGNGRLNEAIAQTEGIVDYIKTSKIEALKVAHHVIYEQIDSQLASAKGSFWVKVGGAVSKLIHLAESSHLDPLHTFKVMCTLIENPNRSLYL
jgi:DNA polymerase III delta prime subunit